MPDLKTKTENIFQCTGLRTLTKLNCIIILRSPLCEEEYPYTTPFWVEKFEVPETSLKL